MCRIHLRLWRREETAGFVPLNDGSIIGVRAEHTIGTVGMGVPDHGEQAFRLLFTVNGPFGVKNLVAAMFRVRLREHQQFNIGWISSKTGVIVCEILNFIVTECEAEACIGVAERAQRIVTKHSRLHRSGFCALKQLLCIRNPTQNRLGHWIARQRSDPLPGRFVLRPQGHTALNPSNAFKSTDVNDLRRFGRPR